MQTTAPATADFAGKYAFAFPNNQLLCLPTSGGATLGVVAGDLHNPTANQQVNLYGNLQSGFTLQAPNWLYVWYNNGYVAEKQRGDAACSVFSLQTVQSNTYLVETASDSTVYYVCANADGTLSRVANTGTPPANAQVSTNQITDSLAAIRQQRSTLANPLTGVYLAGQDLRNIAFMSTDLSFADFSNTTLDSTSDANGATANGTRFDNALLTNWVANGLVCVNGSFVNAMLTNAKLSNGTFTGSTFNKANLAGANLQVSDFTNAALIGCPFTGTLVNQAIFRGANLTNADLSAAKGVEAIISIEGALLIATNLKGHDLTNVAIDAQTNFMSAVLDGCNLTGKNLVNNVFVRASMQGVKLDNTTLDGVQLAFANLTNASITGGITMVGANLANANLQNVNLTGAQLGAKTTLLKAPLSDSSQLDSGQIPADISTGLKLSAGATVQVVQSGVIWQITDGASLYQVNNNSYVLLVQQVNTSNAAVLSNAYMFETNLQQANLFAVEMSGVHWYGSGASALSADLGQANLSNAFLSGMGFKQSQMQGASLDYATLIGTVFDGANLSPSPSLKPTSFAFAAMQSTSFAGTSTLYNANLTNAALALTNGVPLFTLDSSLVSSLNTGSISTTLRTAFANVAYTLVGVASLTVITAGSAWRIANIDSQNAAQTGYGNFYLELVDQENGLSFIQVYGAAPLLLLNSDGKGGQVQLQLAFGATGITSQQLNGNTTCPSGMRYSYLSAYMTYAMLMTPALPPLPPTCLNCWN
ncbi:pentapeptide repeat-containing protein [Fibrella sp. WM1]|uniref:pentapeptide repeat-containing protein n=1 Tax=Fibrella musci TaxID=3242485 RepID=UPI003522CA86